MTALVRLGRVLRASGYAFVTPTPETHRRVLGRRSPRHPLHARTVRDVFGWSRAFAPEILPAPMLELAEEARILVPAGEGLLRSTVRFSTLERGIFAHSAHPTTQHDAVFFGPDTYRFCRLVTAEIAAAKRLVDVGCGSGAGGLVVADRCDAIVLADVNARALAFAGVNAELAGASARATFAESDVLAGVDGPIDAVIANPPYLVDRDERTYRHGGGAFGEGLAVRIVREALARLERGGKLVLYTGAAIVDGADTLLEALRPTLEGVDYRSYEIDPDVFGEELERNDAYASVERIAAVALVATKG